MDKKQLVKLISENEIDVQRARASLFLSDLVFSAYAESEKVYGMDCSPIFIYMVKVGDPTPSYQLILKEALNRLSKKVYENYLADRHSLEKIIKESTALADELDQQWQKYGDDLQALSDNQLSALYDTGLKISSRWWQYAILGEDKGAVIHYLVAPALKNKQFENDKVDELLSLLSHPHDLSILNQERLSHLKISYEIIKRYKKLLMSRKFSDLLAMKGVKKAIDKHIASYFWIKTDFYEAQRVTPEMFLDIVREDALQKGLRGLQKEIGEIKDGFRKINLEQRRLINRLALTKDDKANISFSQSMVSWIDQRKFEMMKQFYYLFMILAEVSRRRNLAYRETSSYFMDEIRRLIKSGDRVPRTELTRRMNGYFVVYQMNQPPAYHYGQSAKKLLSLVTDKKIVGELAGMVASSAGKKKVKGRATVVLNPKIDEFKAGDILVTSMTRIEFVPLMRKAKAIVTNEGGIACHAAVVSRELGTPCIIGTKVATQVIKSGDLIELDMEKGVIKILK